MNAFVRRTAGGLGRLVKSRVRLSLAFCAALLVGAGSAISLAQSDGASGTPFGKPTAELRNPGDTNTAVRAARPYGYADQTRSEVLARNGIAATSQPLATATAEQILMDGGNAIDAAVAAAATLGVVEPESTGLGGDMFAIIWSARDKKLYGMEASGWAPKGWTPEYFRDELGVDEVPNSGINSVVVPGGVSGWDALLKRFGSMRFDKVLEPARSYAEEGFPVHERVAGDWQGAEEALAEDPDSAETFLPGGKAPDMYSIFRNPDLAKALRLIQRGGRDAFYKGPIARAIVEKSRDAGGVMRMSDLAEYPKARFMTPLSTNYHGYDVHQLPPPTQGFAALEMLNILEVCAPQLGVTLAGLGPRDPRYWHLMIEAKKLAYSDLHRYNADPAFEEVPTDRLLSKEHAATLCDEIDMDQARPADVLGNDQGSTVYFSVADRWGNMVSFVNSIFSGFGSKVTVPGYGFPLANRGAGFTLEDGHPNEVAPRKRPFITIIASFITKDGKPVMAFGNMGGGTQPQAHVQHVVNMVDLGMNVQATTDVARFDHSQESDVTALDTYLYDLVGPQLHELGHEISRARGHAGGYQGILFEPDPNLPAPRVPRGRGCCEGALEPRHRDAYERPLNGIYRAGSDPRKDGHAAGW